ncbi:alpha-2-macroglobulin family protein [Longimicrobium sp.]|uniref:alpha-2-macroglobulin family protein n=1 Tax=Longimicrobium sp. TaxID=2029185 RepID=UPI002E2EB0F7|nr:alpha-2-macroglobulin family protein [Longimicrobium sp.]HEX6040571.1 alpha-2-macroglobulin family protein [Longimicrobium sp.]
MPSRAAPRAAIAPAILLPAGNAARILARLPALPTAPTAADSFAFPARTLPPPRTGRVTLAGFPPADSLQPPRPAGPRTPAALAVVRGAPQGEVQIGAEVTVTFSQAMVPLSSVGTVEARTLPVRLSPQPAGSWRWLDVRTLVFTPLGRMPAATEYTVTIPAGTRSAPGGTLGEAVTWTFSTPRLSAIGGSPFGDGVRREPLILLQFDQRIDRAAVASRVRLRAQGQALPVRPATADEIAADPRARSLSQRVDSTLWIAVRPVQPLPYDATVTVIVPEGTPSAEGPLPTRVEQTFSFRTYGPLRVEHASCGGTCRPGMPLVVAFSNALDTAAFQPSWVRVQPAIEGMRVQALGNAIAVTGRTRPNTRYQVTVLPAVRDVFGQTLGRTARPTYDVTTPVPSLTGFGQPMMVLDPAGPRRLSVLSHDHARLRVRIHRVRVEDWPLVERRTGPGPLSLPGTEVVNRVVAIDARPGETTETFIDLDEVLGGRPGQLVVAVEGMDGEGADQATYTWVQATRMGLTAFADADGATVWAASLVDGSPLPGAAVRMERGGAGTTGADGLASIALPADGAPPGWITARLGDDEAVLPVGWDRPRRETQLLWYSATDRRLYRPGEEVRFKGWVRRLERAPDGGLSLPRLRATDSVAWRARDPRGNDIASGTAALTELGGFDARFTVPAGANLGDASIVMEMRGGETAYGNGYLSFQVEEFRRPEYEVAAEADEGPHVVGGSAEVSVRASYFSGGALPGAPVTWRVSSTSASFTPPGWGEWRFGTRNGYYGYGDAVEESFDQAVEGETDTQGRHTLRLHFDRADPPGPHTVTAAATVLDVNRQPWSTTQTLLVHPATVYAGLRTERGWLRAGEPIDLSVVVVDLEGKTVAGSPVDVVATRLEWRRTGARWSEVATDSVPCAVVSGANPVACTFRTGAEGGRWRIAATVRDAQGRPSLTRMDVWVYGDTPWLRGPGQDSGNPQCRVTLVADRERYAPGDTARVLVNLPFWPARGVVTVRREGVVRTETIQSDGPTLRVDVPVGEADIPNLFVRVDAVGADDAAGRTRPTARGTDFATGEIRLAVPPGPRTLTVETTPADSVMLPDAPTSVAVRVRGADGRPVHDAEVALVVVDESVLALTGYRLENPIDLFYPGWNAGVADAGLRPYVAVADTGTGQLHGVVVEARTRQPVAGALVTVEGTALRTVTDAGGGFRLNGVPRGQRTVQVSRPGMEPVARVVDVGDEALPELRFEVMAAVDLDAIVVTGMDMVAEFSGQGRAGGYAPPAAPMPAPAMARAEGAVLQRAEPALQGKVAGAQVTSGAIAVRANFAALALWAPVVRTDAEGRASVPFTLPSNLTRYRVMAVAVSGGTHYGAGESAITARQPLMVRPSAPRFLNFGDRFELPVVVQNGTDRAIDVEVAARGDGIRFAEPGRRVRVPARDRVEVRVSAEAVRPGTAAIQVAAVGGRLADAATITLPVYTPATAEAFATYGSLAGDSAVDLPLEVPDDALPAFGGLEVTTSSTALQELTDAFLYLVRYPYECAEQLSSRVLAVAALRDVLTEFRAEGLPPAQALADSVARDLDALRGMQTPDGGFAFWPGRQEAWPYVSVHATHALVRARGKGYAVPGEMLERSMDYLRTVDRHIPGDYPAQARFAIRAYAAYVRDLAADGGVDGELRTLFSQARLDTIPLEVNGWLLAAVADRPAFAAERAELLRIINNRATETASTATFATAYTEGEYLLLHSERRTDAIVLEALLRADPQSELVTKTVRGLLGHRTRGRWSNTQENGWVLLALDRYFRVYEGQTPEFVARVWLGERFAGERAFNGRTADRHHLEVPMRVLAADDPASLTIGKEGPGRLYYRAGLRYAPRDLDLLPLERGFAVERTYEAMDDSADVVRGEDGRWRVRAGARVRVTVTITAPSRRVHVAMVDPLPAGFEAVNTALLGADASSRPRGGRVSPRAAYGGYDGWRWGGWWYEHQNLRDDRVEAFTSLLPAGVYTYTYVARATTPGQFIVPPPRAEEMYAPETFGRGATDRVIVEEAAGRKQE